MPADPKATSVSKACSVLPTLLLYMYASASIDLVAEIKLPVFVVNHALSPIWSPGQGKDFIAQDLQNEAASDHLGTKGVTLKGWNCVWSGRRVLHHRLEKTGTSRLGRGQEETMPHADTLGRDALRHTSW